MKYLILFFTLLLSFSQISAQKIDSCQYELKGEILDVDTKEALPYVQVKVKGTGQSMLTDINGFFHFKHLCKESNTLILSCFGYCDTICEHFHEHSKRPHFFLKQEVFSLDEITITVEPVREEGTASIAQETINENDLRDNPTQSLASAISGVNGVTFTSMGNNVQLPVIHGLYGNRILILNNGVKHGFQNWGSDHAPEIDITTAKSVTVVKGASGVRYGPEALGGVVIVESAPLYLNEDFKVQIGTGYQTNGRGYHTNSKIEQGKKKWSYYLGTSYTRLGDRHTPDYSLTNSGKQETGVNGGVRYHMKDWDVKVYYSFLDQNLALLRSSVAHSGNALVNAINAKEPAIVTPFSYDINQPNQAIQHHLGKAEINWWYSDDAKLMFRFGKQLNKRDEFDVRRNADRPIIDLDLATEDYQIEWKHPDWLRLNGLIGVQAFTQNNDNNPGTSTTPYIPNYNTLRYSGFIIESLKRNKNTYEVGLRIDYEYNNVRGRETNQDIFRDKYSFSNYTSSLGYIRQVSDNTTFRTNLGTAWRTPNMAELYSFGQHGFKSSYGLLRYYFNESNELRTDNVATINDSKIEPEKGYKWINEWQKVKKSNTITITAYSHFIENYIFDRPYAVVGTIRGPMPAFIVDQTNALFLGTDLTWQKKWMPQLQGTFGLNYLWSKNTEKDETLVNQPPISTNYNLVWERKQLWGEIDSRLSIKPSYTFTQTKAPRTVPAEDFIVGSATITSKSEIFDFMEAPVGVFLLDIACQIKWKSLKVNLAVHNLLNTSYRNYLNEMRYFADELGQNYLISINYMFNKKEEK